MTTDIFYTTYHRLMPHSVKTESLTNQVYKLLKKQFGSRDFRPGERIYEQVLAQRMSISRTPIREALLKLERDGLVICNSRRSYNVRRLTAADVKEIYQILGILEGSVAGLVADQITPADVELLRRYNARMEAVSDKNDFPAFGAWNRKFHDVFLSKSGNHTLCELCDSVRQQLYNFPISRSSLKEWLKKSVREHAEIIRLAKIQDGKGLEKYFRHTHWSGEKNLGYIEKAYDRDGDAAVPT